MELPKNIPAHLYRYRSINDRSLKELSSNKMFFCSPRTFNDPFDCDIEFEFADSEKEIKMGLIENVLESDPPDSIVKNLIMTADTHSKNGTARKSMNDYRDSCREEFLKKSGMLCLSAKNDSILMWSHYSDRHTGMCLEFQSTPNEFFDAIFPVHYTEEYPAVRFFEFQNDPEQQLRPYLFTKSKVWCYESEWRIITPEGAAEYPFPPQLLTGIILGCWIESDRERQVRDALKGRGAPTKVYKAIKNRKRFTFDIELIDTIE